MEKNPELKFLIVSKKSIQNADEVLGGNRT